MANMSAAASHSSHLRPLEGVRVLTIENFVAGPFCTMWLADAGAEVVKVESPAGDFSRTTSPLRTDENNAPRALSFLRVNRNKKSITLDLKTKEGKETFLALARKADIVVENLRPGAMDRLGIGYETLSVENPRLIYVAISGFGQKHILPSPYIDRPAFDIIGQALSGLMYRPDRQDESPVYLGFSLADINSGIVAAYGAMLALFQRTVTGKGQLVDISLYDAALIMNEISVAIFSAFKKLSKPGIHAVASPFGAYRVKDGFVAVAVLGEHVWRRFCEILRKPELLDDPRFVSGVSRCDHKEDLNRIINPWFLERTGAEVETIFAEGGVPASVIQDVDGVLKCPHLAARDMIRTLNDPAWGEIEIVGNPVKMSAVPPIETRPPPELGGDTEEVLQNWLGR
ncbi:CaiB/BaiF CoA-transferase family protein [Acidocella sp.]|uniref:CaiB/BaiF CoA transferase family protein n=1 Tax=Acidocella sp. TaxID=50710 RepID=UPI0026073AAA|nr:CoA transferase [Acidocella sp.]